MTRGVPPLRRRSEGQQKLSHNVSTSRSVSSSSWAFLIVFLCGVFLSSAAAHDSHAVGTVSEKGFLFQDNDAPFTMSFDMYVNLVGLNGDGAHGVRLDERALTQSLFNSLPAGRPSSVDSGQLLSVQYVMSYHVYHSPKEVVGRLERVRCHSLHSLLRSFISLYMCVLVSI